MTQSPTHQDGDIHSASEYENSGPADAGATQPAPHHPRKRVKTGCMTCRKRRIKCGEEKPICSNCIKSKRYCEGYNSRVTLKQSPSSSGHRDISFGGNAPFISHFSPLEGCQTPYPNFIPGPSGQSLRPIAPTPMSQPSYYSSAEVAAVSAIDPSTPLLPRHSSLLDPSPFPLSAGCLGTFSPSVQYPMGDTAGSPQYGAPPRHSSISGPCPPFQSCVTPLTTEDISYKPLLGRSNTFSSFHSSRAASAAQPDGNLMSSVIPGSSPQLTGNSVPTVVQAASTQTTGHIMSPATQPPPPPPPPPSSSQYNTTAAGDFCPISAPTATFGHQSLPPDQPAYLEGKEIIDIANWDPGSVEHDPRRYSARGFIPRPSFRLSIPSTMGSSPPSLPSQMDIEGAEEADGDDIWDLETAEVAKDCVRASEQSKHELGNILISHASLDPGRPTRSFTTFLDRKNLLTNYRPSPTALLQTDEKAARIFCHFVSSTGPCMTVFERSAIEELGSAGMTAISGFQQPLWTYTLPSLALSHPALMHAMLALASLHISKLQHTSPSPSMKHFAYALRRVGRLIGLPQRRNEVPTFAANLLLGFYEIMSAETFKWNIHLAGAKVLAMEIDFAGKTRKIRALRAHMKILLTRVRPEHHAAFLRDGGIPKSLILDQDWDVDEGLINVLTGYPVRYDHQYQTNVSQKTHQNLAFTARDVELYKMQSDLYWWYCKQDVFQSMLSGNRLLMPYEHWRYCPPRGQLSQPDLVYAAMDHLCLIMARLADFGAKDQARKRRAMMAAPGRQQPRTASEQHGSPPSAGQGPAVGYMPPPDQPQAMQPAFATMNANLYDTAFQQGSIAVGSAQAPPSTPVEMGLEVETANALGEHSAISQAFDVFASCLPAGYEALPAGAAPAMSTPFGPALQYRTHTIACMWAFYYAGRILHARLHPSMPPAAMISAQIVAAQTAEHSQFIGKICAGLYYPQQYNLQRGCLNPSLGGALIESTFSLFFAAVQFTELGQRGWTISKLNEIATLGGWQTAAAVAAGCESAWQAMGQAGRGPPYTPTMDWRSKDDRLGDKVLKNAGKEAVNREQRKPAQPETMPPSTNLGRNEQHRHPDDPARMRSQQPFFSSPDAAPARNAAEASHRFDKTRPRPDDRANGSDDDDDDQMQGGKDTGKDISHDSISHDRQTIGTNPYARTHWALGLLSLEEDVAKIRLEE